ncbi:hypothetical protein [Roseomonas chloroacetimidivorans]|uniref:hypothetical protein n=1 Tax=Roseomonas chloroacetimidivorans TaxID=1766656 RepID=UPI003C706413
MTLTRSAAMTMVGVNDNAGPSPAAINISYAEPPEPRWAGPGIILALGVRDGRHGLGAVRASVGPEMVTGDALADSCILIRLLEHYGAWMGFEGQPVSLQAGRFRRLPVPIGRPKKVEYRIDLRRIGRRAQALAADGTILLDGRPAAMLEEFTIAFRSHTPAPTGPGRRAGADRVRDPAPQPW